MDIRLFITGLQNSLCHLSPCRCLYPFSRRELDCQRSFPFQFCWGHCDRLLSRIVSFTFVCTSPLRYIWSSASHFVLQAVTFPPSVLLSVAHNSYAFLLLSHTYFMCFFYIHFLLLIFRYMLSAVLPILCQQ